MTSPMQRAIHAALAAWEQHRYDVTADDHNACTVSNLTLVGVALAAAYPHLYQALTRENRELRAEIRRLNEQISPTQ